MKRMLVATLTALFLAGCSNGTYDKMMEQGESALQEGKYEKALASFELAQDEKPKDEKARAYTDHVTGFMEAQKLYDNGEYEQSEEKAKQMLKDSALPDRMKKDLQEVEMQSANARTAAEDVENRLDAAKRLVDKQEIEKAEKSMAKLKKSAEWKEHGSHFEKQFASIEESIDAAKDGKQRAEKEEQARVAATAKKQEQEAVAVTQNSQSSGKSSDYYYQRLAAIQDEASNLEYHDQNSDSLEVPKEVYRRWDAALNEIYQDLEKRLPSGEMETLRQRQRNWIKERDADAEYAAQNAEADYYAPHQRLYALSAATQERCYELVNLYIR